MENTNQPQNPNIFSSNPKTPLPNSTAVLVLGICSIVFSCFFGVILGIIGLVLGAKGKKIYRASPEIYEGYGQLNAGYIMSIIGTCLGGLYLIYWIIWVVILANASFWASSGY